MSVEPMEKRPITTLEEFAEAFYENRPRYIRIAQRFIYAREVVEDVVNNSMTHLLERRSLPAGANVEAYFYTLLHNACLDYLRQRAVHLRKHHQIREDGCRSLQQAIALGESYDPNAICCREVLQILSRELSRFPALTRDIFLDSRFSDATYEDLAGKYAVSTRKVEKEISRVLKRLRISFEYYLPSLLS